MATCVYCGKAFDLPKFSGKTKHCSPQCRARDARRRHRNSGRGAKYQQEFRSVRPIVLERDGHRCVLCKSDDRLHVHHQDSSGRHEDCNNAENNLVTLCQKCHFEIHRVSLVKIRGKWAVKGKIFGLAKITGRLPIV